MNDFETRATMDRHLVATNWQTRKQAAGQQLGKRIRRRRVVKRVAVSTLSLSIVVGVSFGWWNRQNSTELPRGASFKTTVLADGSNIEALQQNTLFETVTENSNETSVRLRAGKARFKVKHQARRVFRVVADNLTVEVLGTTFSVARDDQRKEIEVAVEEGLVRVLTPSQQILVRPNETQRFSQIDFVDKQIVSKTDGDLPTEPRRFSNRKGPTKVEHVDVARLLKVADEALAQGKPSEAIGALRQILRKHRTDPSAAFAAYDLGAIFDDHLRRYDEAAAAFAEVQRLNPHPELAQDALFKETENLWRAGKKDEARKAANEFSGRYAESPKAKILLRLINEQK